MNCRTFRNLFVSFISGILAIFLASAQDPAELLQINQAAKDIYVQPETLGKLMNRLINFENSVPAGQESLILETYKIISQRYAANNHYKQAYQVHKKYLAYKEALFILNKNKAISQARDSVDKRNSADETQILGLQNQVQQLEIDNDQLISNRSNFKRYFTFCIIALSILFGIMMVNSGFQLNSILGKWKQNRAKMRKLHQIATLGLLSSGLRQNTSAKIQQLKSEIGDINRILNEKKLGNPESSKKGQELESHLNTIQKSLAD